MCERGILHIQRVKSVDYYRTQHFYNARWNMREYSNVNEPQFMAKTNPFIYVVLCKIISKNVNKNF